MPLGLPIERRMVGTKVVQVDSSKKHRDAVTTLRTVSPRVAMIVMMCISIICGMVGCSGARAEAEGALRQGDPARAEAIYRQMLSDNEADLEALKGLAVTLFLQQKYGEALAVQEQVVAADALDVQTRLELGFNYLNHQDRAEDAVTVFEEAAALDGSSKILTFLAQAQEAAGHIADAEATLRMAIDIDAAYAYPYSVLIGLFERNGRDAEAEEVRRAAEKNKAATATEMCGI